MQSMAVSSKEIYIKAEILVIKNLMKQVQDKEHSNFQLYSMIKNLAVYIKTDFSEVYKQAWRFYKMPDMRQWKNSLL